MFTLCVLGSVVPLLLCSETVLVHIEAETQKNGNRCLLFQCVKTAGEGKGAEKKCSECDHAIEQ